MFMFAPAEDDGGEVSSVSIEALIIDAGADEVAAHIL